MESECPESQQAHKCLILPIRIVYTRASAEFLTVPKAETSGTGKEPTVAFATMFFLDSQASGTNRVLGRDWSTHLSHTSITCWAELKSRQVAGVVV